jgi:putative ABC transport system ATP-binding protein
MRSMPERKVLLEAEGVVQDFGYGDRRVRALKGIDLGLFAGQLTLLMGPSGSGKTTLLAILGCILTPTQGRIKFQGEEPSSPEKAAGLRRKHVGFVFQSYNLFPSLTVEENVRVALDLRGVGKPAAMSTTRRVLQSVGLGHKLKSFPHQLSGGEQQRVAVARALVGTPTVILADEPTAALDAKHGMEVMELLARIAHDPDRTVLAVTHDPRTIPFADRVVHIEDGIISDEQHRAEGVPTLHELARSRRSRADVVKPTAAPVPTSCTRGREQHLEFINSTVSRFVPDARPPFTIYDVVKARLAQRLISPALYEQTAREDLLGIFADWDSPDDELASQSDECITSLSALFTQPDQK